MLLFPVILFSFAHVFFVALCETHWTLNAEKGIMEPVSDSPYAVRQPHSLHDFLNQVKWMQELSELRTLVKQQQLLIEKRYDDDDPEIEQKIRKTDENCIRSGLLELQTENFVVSYPIHIHSENIVESSNDFMLRMLELTPLSSQLLLLEPICGKENTHIFDQINDIQKFPETPEPSLADDLSEKDMETLGTHFNLYLEAEGGGLELAYLGASFYWRIRGNLRNALECLLLKLDHEPESLSENFQIGLVYIRLSSYQRAIKHLKFVADKMTNCGLCLMALGDAYVLEGNFAAAMQVYDQAYQIDSGLEMGLKKASLLRCTLKIYEVMESQHTNLLDTIKDVEQFKEKMKRISQLETLIEENRAPAEERLQARLAYEHFEYGPLPHANCRDGTEWLSGGRKRKRLFCTVSSWAKYNEAVAKRKKAKEVQRAKAETAKAKKAEEEQEKKPKVERPVFDWEKVKEYLDRLKPFVGMRMEEPQVEPKYPLKRKLLKPQLPFFRPSWPSLADCDDHFNSQQLHFDSSTGEFTFTPATDVGLELPQLFISPAHKGFIVSELLTKYLSLMPGELSPLPWEMPNCPEDNKTELIEKLQFIPEIDLIKRIKDGEFSPSDNFAEPMLKADMFKLVGYEMDGDEDHLLNEHGGQQQPPITAELAQRIANLIKFGIGPNWISLNLAALYHRLYGNPAEALKCLLSALKSPKYQDVALVQLAQLLLRVNLRLSPSSVADGNNTSGGPDAIFDSIEQILGIAMQMGINEPIPYHLMGILHSFQGHWTMAEALFLQALELDPSFKPSLKELLNRKCSKRIIRQRNVREVFAPICCWPNESEIFCFDQRTKLTNRLRTRCFRLETTTVDGADSDNEHGHFPVQFVYFRCNTPYTGRSYPPPAFAKLISPLLKPAAELRKQKHDKFVRELEAELEAEQNKMALPIAPVLPLDYGGYSPERIRAHQQPLPQDIPWEQMAHSQLDFPGAKEFITNSSSSEPGNEGLVFPVLNEEEKEINSKTIWQKVNPAEMSRVQSRGEVISKLDIPLPNNLPVPPKEMVEKGKLSVNFKKSTLAELCHSRKKAIQLLEQPISTWVSPTAKGVQIGDLIDLDAPVPSIAGLEPECPELSLALPASSILLDLDALPPYQCRHQLNKFYKPEKALKDTFRAIGTSSYDRVEHVAARLYFAIKGASSTEQVHWALSTLSTLYWRVKGDPVNAIKCLRHSLHNSPEKFKDVSLVSLANIYYQAGFLHSALYILGKALETGPDIVAIHFALANVYAAIGDFPHALLFYHSTLALQFNFEPAKIRIGSIHCVNDSSDSLLQRAEGHDKNREIELGTGTAGSAPR